MQSATMDKSPYAQMPQALPPRYHSDTPAQPQAQARSPYSVAQGPQSSTVPSTAAEAKDRYGSLYAHNASWAPSAWDARQSSLPSVDMVDRVKQRFARTPGGDIFASPPPSFSRAPPAHVRTAAPFEPFALRAAGKHVADGFAPSYAGRILAPRDVSVADLARFLEDVALAGRLTGGQRVISNVAPITAHMGATGFLLTKAIEGGMKRRKIPDVAEAVEMWMVQFFAPRGLDVFIVQGGERLTARVPGGQVPAVSALVPATSPGGTSDGSDSDAAHGAARPDFADLDGMSPKQQRRAARREHKAAREEHRAAKKEQRKAKHGKDKARLVVAPLSAM